MLLTTGVSRQRWLLPGSMRVSPRVRATHIPHLPGGHATATPFVVLTLIAVLLGAAGLAGFRRRGVPGA